MRAGSRVTADQTKGCSNYAQSTYIPSACHTFACSSSDGRENSRTSTTTSSTSREAFGHGMMCGVLLRRISGRFTLLHNVCFSMLAIGCGRRKDARTLHERSVRHGAGRPSRGIEPSPHPSRLAYTNDGSTAYGYMKPSVAMLLSKLALRYIVTL